MLGRLQLTLTEALEHINRYKDPIGHLLFDIQMLTVLAALLATRC